MQEEVQLSKQMQLIFDNAYETEKNARWEILIDRIADGVDINNIKFPESKNKIKHSPAIFLKKELKDTIENKNNKKISTALQSITYLSKDCTFVNNIRLDTSKKISSFIFQSLPKINPSASFNIQELLEGDKIDSVLGSGKNLIIRDTNITINFKISENEPYKNKSPINQSISTPEPKSNFTKIPDNVRIKTSNNILKSDDAGLKKDSVSIKFFSSTVRDTISLTLMPVNLNKVTVLFDSMLIQNNIKVNYLIDSTSENSEVKYIVKPKNESKYLMAKIAPQTGLSFLVLSAVVFGFLSMYYSLKKQAMLSIEKQNFISNMTHELKTPVSVVKIALEAIRNFDFNNNVQKRNEYIEIAQNENTKLVRLIDSILDFNKVSHGTLLKKETVINDVIMEMVKSFQIKATEKNVSLLTDFRTKDVTIKTNEEAISFILQNLLENAIKYNQSEYPEITISTHCDNNLLMISVSDNGLPIPEEHREKIFDKFFRIDNDLVHNQKGYGLGLYLSTAYAKAIDGKLTYDRPSNKNIFTLTIPLTNYD